MTDLSPAAQAVIQATAVEACLAEWGPVNDPPCHPDDEGWNGCHLCVKSDLIAAALEASMTNPYRVELERIIDAHDADEGMSVSRWTANLTAAINRARALLDQLERTPQPPVDGEVAEVLQWPAEWTRRQRAQEAETLCCSAGMTPGKEMQQIVEDARDGMPLQHLHDLISHAIPAPQPLPDNYIDPGHTDRDRELLKIFYVACQSEGGTADEIHLRGIRAVMAQPPAAGGVAVAASLIELRSTVMALGQMGMPVAAQRVERAADLLERLASDNAGLEAAAESAYLDNLSLLDSQND